MNFINICEFIMVWASLLLLPPFGMMLFTVIEKQQRRVYKPVLLAFLLFLICILLRISFAEPFINFLFLMIAYAAYCTLAAACWSIPNKIIRVLAILVAFIPICIGYILGTIGVLGLGFILMDYIMPPTSMEQMAPGLTCETTSWGMAATDEGYAINLYRFVPGFPLIRRKVVELSVDESQGQDGATCSQALTKYNR